MNILGGFATALTVIVSIIAVGSLIIVATIPVGSWLQKRRDARAARGG